MLVDTSILLRTLQLHHPQLPIIRNAIKSLTAQGHDPQRHESDAPSRRIGRLSGQGSSPSRVPPPTD
ncbi:MAG TPA: hypothetical protein VHY84_22325 [Bryobacteraceae bacterium]|nr:hypothetical protein [Bryobacteraceae bacterium]